MYKLHKYVNSHTQVPCSVKEQETSLHQFYWKTETLHIMETRIMETQHNTRDIRGIIVQLNLIMAPINTRQHRGQRHIGFDKMPYQHPLISCFPSSSA